MKMTKAQIEALEKAELILTRLHFDIDECASGKKLCKKLDKILDGIYEIKTKVEVLE